MFEKLEAIEKYEDDPRQTPLPLVKEALQAICPKLICENLIGIGGEGILIKAYNSAAKQLLAVKIARSWLQRQYAQMQKPQIVNVFSFKGKPKATNVDYTRFLEGARLQSDLATQVMEDQQAFVHVPLVIEISDSPLYIVMPYLENLNVLRFFKDFNKKLKDILIIYLTFLKGIEYFHNRGIVHRDLKSDNIMIHKNMKSLVLLDWTLAKSVGNRNLTLSGHIGGTPGFASEKMMSGGFKDANFRDDIQALGFVLWEFVTGKRLANEYNQGSRKLKKSEQEDFKRRISEYVPECLKFIFWKATEFYEKDRYQSVEELIAAIKEIMTKYDLSAINTIIGEAAAKEVDVIFDEVEKIIDTTIIHPICEICDSKEICRDVELCNLFYNFLRILK